MDLYRQLKRLLKQVAGQDVWTRTQFKCQKVEYGGWSICPAGLSVDDIVYSLGVGSDVTFDLAMIEKYQTKVYAFDPTPNSIEWVKASRFPDSFHFFDYGVSNIDGEMTLYPRVRKGRQSKDMLTPVKGGVVNAGALSIPVKRLGTIMKMLGHSRIDILKIDIEASEYDVIDDLIQSGINVYQILVEFHHRFPSVRPEQTRQAINMLNNCGFKIFDISTTGREYSFINIAEYEVR